MTDINLKEMMFAQKMKEIEDDVPPFGIIDDGTDYLREEQLKEDAMRWYQTHGVRDIDEW
jgi:hypothetical protein